MSTRIIAGKTVQVNEEGYMTDPSEWTKDIAVELAKVEGLMELTPSHWKIIDYAREKALSNGGAAPTLRTITTNAGVNTKELFTLFPKGPAKKVAKIAGLGKPEGCV